MIGAENTERSMARLPVRVDVSDLGGFTVPRPELHAVPFDSHLSASLVSTNAECGRNVPQVVYVFTPQNISERG